MLTKSSRLAMIRNRYAALFGAPSSAELCAEGAAPVLALSETEVAETVATETAVAIRAEAVEVDESEQALVSQLHFDTARETKVRESDSLLSPSERASLLRDVLAHRVATTGQFSRFPIMALA